MCGCERGEAASTTQSCHGFRLLLLFQDVRSSYKFLSIAIASRQGFQPGGDGLTEAACNEHRRHGGNVGKPPDGREQNPESGKNQQGSVNVKRRDFLKLGVAATAAGAIGAPAFAQAKIVLKATDVHPLGY